LALKATAIVANDTMSVQFDGFAIYETSGSAAASVTFRDGVVGGNILFPVELAAGESAGIVFPEAMEITHASGDLYVVSSGAVEGAVLSRVNTGP
jgi:hypothetical protein